MTTPAPPGTRLAAPPETLDDDPPVRALMSPLAPVEVPATTRVATALDHLRRLDAGHLVLRGHGRLSTVAEADLLRHALAGGASPARLLDPVSDLARPTESVGPETRRSRAAARMLAHDHPVLIVVADGEPCGVLDARTILHSVAETRR
ncbi:CBS domain-containing protein [Actinomycetospora sp. C-140]